MDIDHLSEDEVTNPWPAFADLLAASTMLFLVLFAVVAIPAIVENGVIKGKENTLERLQMALSQDSSAKTVQVTPVGDYLLIRIAGDATFPQNESDLQSLKEEGRNILRGFADRLKQQGILESIDQIQVVGHTSPEGTDERNWQLSSERAATVALYLIKEGGLSPCKVTALGRGRFYPVDPDAARTSGQINPDDRRIELEIRPVVVGDSTQQAQRERCVDERGVMARR